jgi:hypothetical protein
LSLFRRVVVLDICPHLLASVGRLLQLVRVGVVVALGTLVSALPLPLPLPLPLHVHFPCICLHLQM